MTPLVSILIPAYNAEQWISDTIKSALAQTWTRKEIIVVDDGSRDATFEVAKQFSAQRVKVVTQANQGAAGARNAAYQLCQGDYIQWLDADDLLAPTKLAFQMAAAEDVGDKRVLLSSKFGYFMFRPNRAKFLESPLWTSLNPVEWLIRKWEHNVHMQTATWLVSRELTQLAGPWDSRLLGDDDGEYFFRVIRNSRDIRFIPSAEVYYRVTPSSRLSHIGTSDRKMEAQFFGMTLQISYLRDIEDSDRVRAACVRYLQTWLPHFLPERPDLVRCAEELAIELGGRLERPKLSWKYAWIEKLFGSATAKRSQLVYNEYKSRALRNWDKLLWQFERSQLRAGLPGH